MISAPDAVFRVSFLSCARVAPESVWRGTLSLISLPSTEERALGAGQSHRADQRHPPLEVVSESAMRPDALPRYSKGHSHRQNAALCMP